MESKTLQCFQFNSSLLKSEQLLKMKEVPVRWGLTAGLGLVKNYFRCPSKDGLAGSFYLRYVNEFRPWTHFLTASSSSAGPCLCMVLSLHVARKVCGVRSWSCSEGTVAWSWALSSGRAQAETVITYQGRLKGGLFFRWEVEPDYLKYSLHSFCLRIPWLFTIKAQNFNALSCVNDFEMTYMFLILGLYTCS